MPHSRSDDQRTHGAPIPSPEADALVVRARASDIDAFAELFRMTFPMVLRFLHGRCGDRALAEDLAQETYVRAMRSVERFDGSSSDFVGWTMRIARNLFLDHVKSGRVRWETVVEELPAQTSRADPEAQALGAVSAAELRKVLERLTPEQQEVVHLRFIEDLSIAEVAVIVGRNEGAVKALQFRALRSLERLLRDEGGLGS